MGSFSTALTEYSYIRLTEEYTGRSTDYRDTKNKKLKQNWARKGARPADFSPIVPPTYYETISSVRHHCAVSAMVRECDDLFINQSGAAFRPH